MLYTGWTVEPDFYINGTLAGNGLKSGATTLIHNFFSGGRISGFWNIDPCCDVTILEKQLLGQNFDLRCIYQFFEIAEAYIDHQYDVRTRIKILKFVKPVLRSQCICLKMVILILLSPFVNVVRIRTILDQIWGYNNKEIRDTSQKESKGWGGIRIL